MVLLTFITLALESWYLTSLYEYFGQWVLVFVKVSEGKIKKKTRFSGRKL